MYSLRTFSDSLSRSNSTFSRLRLVIKHFLHAAVAKMIRSVSLAAMEGEPLKTRTDPNRFLAHYTEQNRQNRPGCTSHVTKDVPRFCQNCFAHIEHNSEKIDCPEAVSDPKRDVLWSELSQSLSSLKT